MADTQLTSKKKSVGECTSQLSPKFRDDASQFHVKRRYIPVSVANLGYKAPIGLHEKCLAPQKAVLAPT